MATVSCGTTSARFGFIQRYRELGVTRLCQWLDVSTSGFYAWTKREASKRDHEDQALMALIDRIYWESEGRYGSPRVHKVLETKGIAVSRKRVARLMRTAGLVGRVTQVTRKQPGLKRFKAAGENLLLGMMAPDGINRGYTLGLITCHRWNLRGVLREK